MFGGTKYGHFHNEKANFRHIGRSALTLFQMMTGDEWSRIMRDMQVVRPFCTLDADLDGSDSDCGTNFAILYFLMFYGAALGGTDCRRVADTLVPPYPYLYPRPPSYAPVRAVIMVFVALNLFVAVVLDNFSSAYNKVRGCWASLGPSPTHPPTLRRTVPSPTPTSKRTATAGRSSTLTPGAGSRSTASATSSASCPPAW